ncbi:MAG: hypothetical protein IT581_05870 [Verrucomicrobiales bacterium]|nr:hypothetical protein [Verrucomicrobiales bacterium]
MTLTLTSPRVFRIPTSYVALLLPVLPLLVSLARTLSDSSWYDFLSWNVAWLVALGIAGAVIALGLPSHLESLSRQRRKEAEQLLGPWLASLFVVQVPLVIDAKNPTLAMIVFTATCALLASIPFGIEFQHRTLAGLLSQPVDRTQIAKEKLKVLGIAIAAHSALFLLAWQSTLGSFEFSNEVLLGWVIGIAVACTAPWWTLMTRGVLPGLVFSCAVPLAVVVVWGYLASESQSLAASADSRYAGLHLAISALGFLLATAAPPVAAILGLKGTIRRWNRLEARDGVSLDHEGIFAQGFRCAWLAPLIPRGPILRLLLKESRLQTVTWAALTLALVSGLASASLADRISISYLREYLNGLVMLFGSTTLILAGATSLAEERRLGTLDAQLLLPATRRLQWGIKVIACLLLAVPAAALLVMALPSGPFVDRPAPPLILLACAWAFSLSFLASSGSANTLRALILSLVLSGASLMLLIFQWTVGPRIEETTHFLFGIENAEATVAHADSLGGAAIEQLRDRLNSGNRWAAALGLVLVFLPLLVPWFLSWRNFVAPMQAVRRLRLQAVACVFFLFVCVLGTFAVRSVDWTRTNYANQMVMGWDTARYRERLSKAEDQLWRTPTIGSIPLGIRGVALPIWTPIDTTGLSNVAEPVPRQWVYRNFSLPLSPVDRETIVRQARIPNEVRDALRREANLPPIPEAELPPRPTPSTPPPGSARQILIDPALAARYGLIVPGNAENAHVAENPNPQAAPPRTDASHPASPQMSPELMRRYGLLPSAPATAVAPTNATNAEPPKP